MTIRKSRKTCLWYRRKGKIPHSYKSFKTSTKSWINTKRVHRVIQFNQEAWLRPYIDMNKKLRKEEHEFEKDFFKLMNNCFQKNNGKCEKA